MTDLLLLASRLLLAGVFIPNGWMKLADVAATTTYFRALDLPFPEILALGTGVYELGAGLLIVAGILVRPVAVALAAFCLAAGFIGHWGVQTDDAMLAFMHVQALLKDIGLAGGFLALAVAGPGAWAIGRRAAGR